jgi:hypothetical protein
MTVEPAASRQPGRFLTAQWRDLAMLNYEIAPAVLTPYVPRGTELDAWNGRTLVSVVGFRFIDTRVRGVAVPLHRDFEELNLRFYVRREAEDGWRRGVVFVKEVVPRRAVAWLARVLYNENYVALPMRHAIATEVAGAACVRRVSYEWLHGRRWHGISVQCAGAGALPKEESEETFISEHYWGYVRQRDGGTVEYRVEHPRWAVACADVATLHCDVAAFYGPEFATFLAGRPTSAFLADGSPVTVRAGVKL